MYDIFKCEVIKEMIDKDVQKTFVYTDTHIYTQHISHINIRKHVCDFWVFLFQNW